ncbi:MAG: hypothetical protein U1F40_00920 [Turneriella sp.]
MYIYFIAAFSLAALACWGLSSILRKRGRNLPLIFFGGLAYILVALPIVWSLYLYFALGFIGIGVLFMALSKYSLPAKLQAPLVALPIVSLYALMWYNESSYNIFLIPEGYRGRVVIVHGCKDGAPREFEGFYRIYRIGQNGLLKSRFSFAGSAFDSLHSKYFFVDKFGKRSPISEDISPQSVAIQGLWTLGAERNGETGIDFIVDAPITDTEAYRPNEKENWQREIDSCAK